MSSISDDSSPDISAETPSISASSASASSASWSSDSSPCSPSCWSVASASSSISSNSTSSSVRASAYAAWSSIEFDNVSKSVSILSSIQSRHKLTSCSPPSGSFSPVNFSRTISPIASDKGASSRTLTLV